MLGVNSVIGTARSMIKSKHQKPDPIFQSLLDWHHQVLGQELRGERQLGEYFYDELDLMDFRRIYINLSEDKSEKLTIAK